MKANEYTIGKILTGGNQFFVPSYQRPYKWDADDAVQLVRDIDESREQGESEYFIGSIICIQKPDEPYEIVDGQQRLITLTLVMQQMAQCTEDATIRGDMLRRLVTDPYATKGGAAALEVRRSEHDFYYRHIIDGGDVQVKMTKYERVFLKNRDAIGDFLSAMKQDDIRRLAAYLINKVYVVFVEVDNRESSFRLFNVLNNRGMRLNDADLLKNALLGKVAEDDYASRLVDQQWREIESVAEEHKEEPDAFLALLQISEKTDRNRVKEKNYKYYEGLLANNFNGDSAKMSNMLLSSAQRYGDILGGKTTAASTTAFLAGFAKPDEWIPAFMAFLNKHGPENLPEFAALFEKVYMQAWLTRVPKSQREAACYYAVEAINGGKSFSDILLQVRTSRTSVDNQRFEKSLDAPDFYDDSRPRIVKLVQSVLLRVEQARHDENMPQNYAGKITVEHILPQNMPDDHPYWSKKFSTAQHDEWVHKLGNLTLISRGKNSAAKNLGFGEKKLAYERANQKCPFEITKELCDLPEWDMAALQSRHDKLKREIMDLWWVGELV